MTKGHLPYEVDQRARSMTHIAERGVAPNHCGARARTSRPSRVDVLLAALVVGAAYAMKRYYAAATPEQLRWALYPTTKLVESWTGVSFHVEHGVGFVSESRFVVIAKACAGINFFIVALLSAAFGLVRSARGAGRKALSVAAAGLVAYVAMIVANATRIALGMSLAPHLAFAHAYRADIHRVEGVVTYLAMLCVLAAGVRAVTGETARGMALPLCSYIAITLGIPIARNGSTPGFARHAVTILLAIALLAAARLALRSKWANAIEQ